MRRKIVMALLIVISCILQCSLFQLIEIASIKPNLLLILTVSFGLMRGRRSGLLTGFFCGLCCDLFFESILGFQALLYMWIGYFSGFFYRIFYDDDIKTPLLLISGADLVYGICQYAFTFLLRGRIHFFFYLRRIIIPEVLYTLILTIITYRLIYYINQKLCRTDKRSIDSLV
ncbi:MAG TPA: rod shape-determining protein MreD [Candidatus Merdiplasma excrementigallinarum]|uniref:Rod shape-determining protein MreD n=1 Tax=Candidatus Merdiplasma excrementigallinarum TaxID=2840864 RepID=A0A9D1T7L7_9FIRM|nr:rod shape-determining protein MreD [Candidatus Merdiplasma excrementigallinarum]